MGDNVNLVGIQWRKSSYSGDQGGQCVECAPFGLLTWRKSSYSGDQGGECVEVAETPCLSASPTIAIRDSKNPAGPRLTLAPVAFTSFVTWTATPGADTAR